MYVDDGVRSVDEVDRALEIMRGSVKLCERFGFKLRKFASNSEAFMQAVKAEDSSCSTNLKLGKEELMVERTLGCEWCVSLDVLQFTVKIKDKPNTKRGVLSIVSSIFDPLGLVSPVILKGKAILQSICANTDSDWDTEISDSQIA